MYEIFIGIHNISISHGHALYILYSFSICVYVSIICSQGLSVLCSWGTFVTAVILISEEMAPLLPGICLARSNTKWVVLRFSLLFWYEKWLLQYTGQLSTGKKKKWWHRQSVSEKDVWCLWAALCAESEWHMKRNI